MFKLKQIIPQDFCLKCEGCCRFSEPKTIWSPCLLEEESERLNTQDKKVRLIAQPQENIFICEFLNRQENKCKIYFFRPFECQLYPFILHRKHKTVFLAAHLECPFVKKNISASLLKEYVRYLVIFLQHPNISNIIKKNPQLIQTYSGVFSLAALKI